MGLLITCTLVTTLYATAMTIANVSLPQIQGALSAGPDQVAWVVTANLIATAVTIPLAGWMSNRFGRRRVMIFGVAGFAVSTLLCGLSSSLEALILWRVFQILNTVLSRSEINCVFFVFRPSTPVRVS